MYYLPYRQQCCSLCVNMGVGKGGYYFEIILLTFMIITSHHILQVHANGPSIGDFFKQIKPVNTSQEVDLVILMDRSSKLTKQIFYLRSRQIISSILKNYVLIHPRYVRLTVVTFADKATVIIDGIASNNLTKCDLFEGQKQLWNNVTYDDKVPGNSNANVSAAFWKAYSIFTENNTNRTKIILIITYGEYNIEMDPVKAKEALIKINCTAIFAIGVGPDAKERYLKIRSLASKTDYYVLDENNNTLQMPTLTMKGMRL